MVNLLNNMPSGLFPLPDSDLHSGVNENLDLFIIQMLHSLRIRLDMEVAFISQFSNGRRIFKYIDSAKNVDIIRVGASDPLDESYCQRVVDGRLPELIQNAQLLDVANELAATKLVPIGGHLSVPIYLSDGKLFGTYCAFCRHARMDLNDRDHALMRVFADITASLIENNKKQFKDGKSRWNQIQTAILERDYYAVFQPILHIKDKKLWGYEALTRFGRLSGTPDKIFEQAGELGLGEQLGSLVIARALEDSAALPQSVFINLNATPELIASGALLELFSQYGDLNRFVLEITEHVIIQDYQEILSAIDPLRKKGMRLAIDDTGAGYASFRHILLLKPEIIKLDMSLIRDIDQNEEKQALTAALVAFSRRGKHLLIAEGVETQEEFSVLRDLGVDLVQGYLFSKPMPVAHFTGISRSYD
jgi:EAL domain-containing protein (putative c-di-GMP-specific phosphodiesterase class I)